MTISNDFVPAADFMRVDSEGRHWLAGNRCRACGTIVLGARVACSRCCARDSAEEIRLSDRGTLYTHTIVHRSYPGVATPFVSAVVDLDGGGTVKGILTDIEPTPAALVPALPLRLVFRDSGQRAPDGRPFLAYFFIPAERPDA